MEVIVTIVSKLVYNVLTGLRLTTYLYRGEIIHLLSTMDIPVDIWSFPFDFTKFWEVLDLEVGVGMEFHLSFTYPIHYPYMYGIFTYISQ